MTNTSKTATELLHTQLSGGANTTQTSSDKSKLQTNEPFFGTPVWMRGSEENGYCATLGDYQITKKFPTLEEVESQLAAPDINLIMSIFWAMNESTKTLNKIIEENNIMEACSSALDELKNTQKINATDTAFNEPENSNN